MLLIPNLSATPDASVAQGGCGEAAIGWCDASSGDAICSHPTFSVLLERRVLRVMMVLGEAWRGDREQIAALYRELGPIIHRKCLSLLRDPEEARDATQEVFVKLVSAGRLNDREHAAAWIYRAATRHCLNLLRDSGRRDGKLRQRALELSPTVSADVYPARELTRQVLRQFDETTCTVAVGVLVDEIDQIELAEILGLSRRTIARKLEKFLAKARELIAGGQA